MKLTQMTDEELTDPLKHEVREETWESWINRYQREDGLGKITMLARVEGVTYGKYMTLLTAGHICKSDTIEKARRLYEKGGRVAKS